MSWSVSTEGEWNGTELGAWKSLFEPLLPLVDRNIVLLSPHWRPHKPRFDSNFNVYVWSGPEVLTTGKAKHGTAYSPTPDTLYGMQQHCRDLGYFPSWGGVTFESTEGFPVAQLHGDSDFYIFFDINHYGRSEELKIGGKIVDELRVVLELMRTQNGQAQIEHYLMQQRMKRSNRFSRFANGPGKHHLSLATAKQKVTDGRDAVVRHTQRFCTLGFLDSLSENLAFSPIVDRYSNEWDKIKALRDGTGEPLLENDPVVNESASTITIQTRSLCCRDPDTTSLHRSGRMEIVANFQTGEVLWKNLDGTATGETEGVSFSLQAPGVDEDGTAFDNSLVVILADTIARGRLAQVFELATRYVENVSQTTDWIGNVSLWPLFEEGQS